MNNKVKVGILMISFFLAGSVYAKPKEQPGKQLGVDDVIAKMKFQLQLTDAQIVEVKPIVEDYLAGEKQLKLDEKNRLSKVLTKDQLYTWNFLQNAPPDKKKHGKSIF